jgi:hypothetical protein
MDDKDSPLLRQVAREEARGIFETEFLDAFLQYLDALDAANMTFRKYFDSNKIGKRERKEIAAVLEETFKCLNFESQKGAKIGDYEVAHRSNNLPEKFDTAFNVLSKSSAVISNRYFGSGYAYSYWLYGKDKVYRQKLKEQ